MKIVLVCLLPLLLCFCSCQSNRTTAPAGSAGARLMNDDKPAPVQTEFGVTYRKVRDDLFDRKHMTRISIVLIVQDGITRTGVESLLWKYFREADARRGFKFRPRASQIDVSAYVSEDHFNSDMRQWLAIVWKFPTDSTPQEQFDEVQLAQVGVAPAERFGLSDSLRRLLFRRLIQQRTPYVEPLREMKTADSLLKTGIYPQAVLDSISAEGQAKHWAWPPAQINR